MGDSPCQAILCIKIRRRLTRQIYGIFLKTFQVKKDLDPIATRFGATITFDPAAEIDTPFDRACLRDGSI